jgi:4'-phosphopantetheinyl transferase EntD
VIEEILPRRVKVVEAYLDATPDELVAEEQAAVLHAVPRRRREFATARACARSALAQLGVPATSIPMGARGEPCWPAGAIGSITHCSGYRGCAVALAGEYVAIGIDAEPHAPLPKGIEPVIARPEEHRRLRALSAQMPDVHWDRLLFSVKESIYKAWFPRAKRSLGFEDASVTLDAGRCTFTARLMVDVSELAGARSEIRGRWLVRDGYVLTAVVQPLRGGRERPEGD